MPLEAKRREMHTGAENAGFRKDAHAADSVYLHLHVRVAVGVAEVRKMWAPGGILCVAFDDNRVLVERFRES